MAPLHRGLVAFKWVRLKLAYVSFMANKRIIYHPVADSLINESYSNCVLCSFYEKEYIKVGH